MTQSVSWRSSGKKAKRSENSIISSALHWRVYLDEVEKISVLDHNCFLTFIYLLSCLSSYSVFFLLTYLALLYCPTVSTLRKTGLHVEFRRFLHSLVYIYLFLSKAAVILRGQWPRTIRNSMKGTRCGIFPICLPSLGSFQHWCLSDGW